MESKKVFFPFPSSEHTSFLLRLAYLQPLRLFSSSVHGWSPPLKPRSSGSRNWDPRHKSIHGTARCTRIFFYFFLFSVSPSHPQWDVGWDGARCNSPKGPAGNLAVGQREPTSS